MSGLRQIAFYWKRGIRTFTALVKTPYTLADLGQKIMIAGCDLKAHTPRLRSLILIGVAIAFAVSAHAFPTVSDPLPADLIYLTFPNRPFSEVKEFDERAKPRVMERQRRLLEGRYDLSDRPMQGLMMSGRRKAVQAGVRVKLPKGVTWGALAEKSPDEIREQGLLPAGFMPLPHVKHATGGQVFPEVQINEIGRQEGRDLRRFDVDFDLPDHLTPEFPPPIFLTSHPELGDVSRGELLTIRNFNEIMSGIITPVQMEGLRLLLTPFPQEEFNETEDRKAAEESLGVACLDCHSNFHTNAAFHLTPDVRPQTQRFRLDTTSLRGLFNQQIHGSKRSLRSIEDFTEFEQRTAYFNGDHVSAARKGVNLLDRASQVSMMAQMQNMIDFPPAPKLDVFGRLDPSGASEQELEGEQVFMGKGGCAVCHVPETAFVDNNMHDLKLERFYRTGQSANDLVMLPDGPIKTFTLRGIKDSPPYLHDGRLLTLADTVEFFNLVLGTKLTQREKDALVAYLLAL
ncbi:cytochrome B6 [Sinorhizobium mexicanum]|nr:cytochrome B6 [Sinorhizobium mexicanum]MBP1884800.1 cytochrome c peroxidase [Sinorhizobium mexicanum]